MGPEVASVVSHALERGHNFPLLIERPEVECFLLELCDVHLESNGTYPLTVRHVGAKIFSQLRVEFRERIVSEYFSLLSSIGVIRCKTGPGGKTCDAGDWLPTWEFVPPED